MSSYFVGIDPAWSAAKPSAGAALKDGGELVAAVALQSDEDIVDFITSFPGETVIVSLDIPLVVKNPSGSRPVDRTLQKMFGRFEAGPYPVNLSMPFFSDGGRGWRIMRRLEGFGFKYDPFFPPRCTGKYVVEVFPHPAHVVLFRLDRTLKYKKKYKRRKKKQAWCEAHSEWNRYREYLLGLRNSTPRLIMDGQSEIIDVDITRCIGKAYKRYDDLLDAITCAYISYYYWYWGEDKCAVVGDLASGCIVTPVDERMATVPE